MKMRDIKETVLDVEDIFEIKANCNYKDDETHEFWFIITYKSGKVLMDKLTYTSKTVMFEDMAGLSLHIKH